MKKHSHIRQTQHNILWQLFQQMTINGTHVKYGWLFYKDGWHFYQYGWLFYEYGSLLHEYGWRFYE